MNLSFECQQCQADFELDLADVVEDPTLVTCPNCGMKADSAVVETFAHALDEVVSVAGRLYRRFQIEFSLDADELDVEPEEVLDDKDGLWTDDVEEDEPEED
jgi:uncharacterized Zn finger protein